MPAAPTGADHGPPVLVIVGAPRSGTSLVYRALCLHPEAAWVSGWQRRAPRHPVVSRVDRVAAWWPDRRRAAWFPGGNAYVYGRHRRPLERLLPAPVEGEPVLRAAGVPDPDAGPVATTAPPATAARLRRTLARITHHGGGRVLVTKRIAHNRRLPWLADALPSARVVAVVRDGRAVAASLARVDWWPDERLWWADTTVAAWRAAGGDDLAACAGHWAAEVGAVDDGLARLASSRVLRIRYEDLVADPVTVLAGVARFAGLAASPTFAAELAALDVPEADHRWRHQLGASGLATVQAVAGPQLEARGYVDADASTARTAGGRP